MIINSNTMKEKVQEKTKETFQNMCFIGANDKKKTTLRESIEKTSGLKVSHVTFSDYDFIRLFLAYLRKNGEIFFDRESLPYDLYPFILGGYEVLFQDIAIKEQIEGNYLEIQEALQKASLGGIISAYNWSQ